MKFNIILSLFLSTIAQNILSNPNQTNKETAKKTLSQSTSIKSADSKSESTSIKSADSKSESTSSSKFKNSPIKLKRLSHADLDYYHKDVESNIQKLPTLHEKLMAEANLKSLGLK
jgi:hypothetical protein